MSLSPNLAHTEPVQVDLPTDTVFSTLSNSRRRGVLRLLRESEEPLGIRDLTEQIAAWENDTTVEDVTYKERKRVYTSLHQTHLPMLQDAGLIDVERSWEGITLTERASVLELYLEVPEADLPWSEYYAGFALVGLALVSISWLNVAPFANFPGLAYAGLLSLALLVTAGLHTYKTHQHSLH